MTSYSLRQKTRKNYEQLNELEGPPRHLARSTRRKHHCIQHSGPLSSCFPPLVVFHRYRKTEPSKDFLTEEKFELVHGGYMLVFSFVRFGVDHRRLQDFIFKKPVHAS